MTSEIEKVLKGMMDDIIEQVHVIMASEAGINSKTGRNTLAGSDLDREVSGKITGEGLDIEFNHYIVYLEWNRPEFYGKKPPYHVILNWLKRKNIQPKAETIKDVYQLAWVMQYVIWRDGWRRRIIAGFGRWGSPLDEAMDNMWDDRWADELYDAIAKELELYFKD